jgi:AraC-like DNA-binding protein
MHVQFHRIEPHPLLKPHVSKMWVFRSDGKMPDDDVKLVVPNGNLKLTVSCKNGIVAAIDGQTFSSKEHDITLSGLINVPVILDAEKDVPTETIGIEFNPKSAHRFFRFSLNEIQNRIYSINDLMGPGGRLLIEQINNTQSISTKLDILQQYLIGQLSIQNEDLIFEHCIDKIVKSNGAVTVKELEDETGYSSRWLNMKFGDKLGTSPKNLASIIRFKHYYQSFISDNEQSFFREDFYRLYYDQSHFIKDFKRFTGFSPTKLEKRENDFGKRYFEE